MELLFPDIPGDTFKPMSEEEVSSLPTSVKAPVLLRKAKYYKQQCSSPQSHSRGMLQSSCCSSFPSLNYHHEALH